MLVTFDQNTRFKFRSTFGSEMKELSQYDYVFFHEMKIERRIARQKL